jgi:serine/tyrosine/threonine adenylyltransferase
MKEVSDDCGKWNFDNSFAKLPTHFYELTPPTPVSGPHALILNHELAQDLGLALGEKQILELAGNILPTGSIPLAQAYAGHQFGHFTMLGDGRAVLLGEHITPKGLRVDIQLKGSGPTPFFPPW